MRDALSALDASSHARPLGARRHGFTHFTLAYTPYLVRLDARRPRVCEPNQRWLRLDQMHTAPLPAPMRTLLAEVRELLAQEQQRAT